MELIDNEILRNQVCHAEMRGENDCRIDLIVMVDCIS